MKFIRSAVSEKNKQNISTIFSSTSSRVYYELVINNVK